MINEFQKKTLVNSLSKFNVINILFDDAERLSYGIHSVEFCVFFKIDDFVCSRVFSYESTRSIKTNFIINEFLDFVEENLLYVIEKELYYISNEERFFNYSKTDNNKEFFKFVSCICDELNSLGQFGIIQGRENYNSQIERTRLIELIVPLNLKGLSLKQIHKSILLEEGFDCLDFQSVVNYK